MIITMNKNKTTDFCFLFILLFCFVLFDCCICLLVVLFYQIKGVLAFECNESIEYDGMLFFFMPLFKNKTQQNKSVSVTLATCEIAQFFSLTDLGFQVGKNVFFVFGNILSYYVSCFFVHRYINVQK